MGLLLVPGALAPQRRHELGEPLHLERHGRDVGGDPHRREVVRLDVTIEVVPGHVDDALVGQTEALDHGEAQVVGQGARAAHVVVARRAPGQAATQGAAGVQRLADGELDRGQHVDRVALGHEQRAALPRRLDLEPVAVDHPRPDGDGVDAQPGPREIEERQGREDDGAHPVVGEQELDGAFGHHG